MPSTLKQRLAVLVSNTSALASSSIGPLSPGPASPRLRDFFMPRRDLTQEFGHDRVQDVMSNLIFQAGVDYETRPMVVMNASALPDPEEVSYDLLLSHILSYLNLYVESDYTVVFFAAGGRHTPGWNWVWKAYRSLSRKYRKNLKRLFIVHSNFFTKMLFSLAGAIISPKFFRKITYVNTLSELAYYVPLTQINIPAAVYQENMKLEREITLPVPAHADLFGVPLEELMGFNGEKGGLPRVVKDCIMYLRETGMTEEGLFRRSPNSALLREVQQAYDRRQVVSLKNFNDPHLAAVLLKKYLRDLPEPLFPESIYPVIRRCPPPTNDPSDMSSVAYIRDTLLPELPQCSYILLNHVFNLLHEVSLRSASNRMDAHNLALVVSPNLVASPNPLRDVQMCAIPTAPAPAASPAYSTPAALAEGKTTLGMVAKLCIQRYYEIFDEVPDRTEALSHFASASASASTSSSPQPPTHRYRDSMLTDDSEEIDDAVLVMPIGPNRAAPTPPSAWAGRPLRDARSMHTAAAGGGGAYASVGKAKSMISIEKGGGTSRMGSISIGRGNSRKAAGAGVTAMGITAAGFFTAEGSTPPVPALPGRG